MTCKNCGTQLTNGVDYCCNCKSSIIGNSNNQQAAENRGFVSTFSNSISEEERKMVEKQIRSISALLTFSTVLSFIFPIISLIFVTMSTHKIKVIYSCSAFDILCKAKKLKSKTNNLKLLICSIVALRTVLFAVCILLCASIHYFPVVYDFVLKHEKIFRLFLFLIR